MSPSISKDPAGTPGNASTQDPIGPHGADAPSGGLVSGGGTEGTPPLDFDDGDVDAGRGNSTRMGGTYAAQGGDSGRLGPPSEQFSDRNGPSDTEERGGGAGPES